MFLFLCGQECEVEKESIRGVYTGECKKGKAHGKGKSVGTDIYEGNFRNGLPDGEGKYTWKNNNVFEGKFVKGLMDGKGKMTYKMNGTRDSTVEGFWKKDKYFGKYENPWLVHSRSGSVRSIDGEYFPSEVMNIKINVHASVGSIAPSNFVVIKGNYERITSDSFGKTTESTLSLVVFPFRIKFDVGRDQVEIEFFEPGSYKMTVNIH